MTLEINVKRVYWYEDKIKCISWSFTFDNSCKTSTLNLDLNTFSFDELAVIRKRLLILVFASNAGKEPPRINEKDIIRGNGN